MGVYFRLEMSEQAGRILNFVNDDWCGMAL